MEGVREGEGGGGRGRGGGREGGRKGGRGEEGREGGREGGGREGGREGKRSNADLPSSSHECIFPATLLELSTTILRQGSSQPLRLQTIICKPVYTYMFIELLTHMNAHTCTWIWTMHHYTCANALHTVYVCTCTFPMNMSIKVNKNDPCMYRFYTQ